MRRILVHYVVGEIFLWHMSPKPVSGQWDMRMLPDMPIFRLLLVPPERLEIKQALTHRYIVLLPVPVLSKPGDEWRTSHLIRRFAEIRERAVTL